MLWMILLGCRTTIVEGTAVGNPGDSGDVALRIAQGGGITHSAGAIVVDALQLTGCDGTSLTEPVNDTIDLMAGEVVVMPTGQWCEVVLDVDGLSLAGDGDGGGSYTLELAVSWVTLVAPVGVTVDGGAYLLQLAGEGWIDSKSLGLAEGDVTIDSTHPDHDALVLAIEEGSALYTDLSGDGQLDGEDVAAGALAMGADRGEDDGEDEDEDD